MDMNQSESRERRLQYYKDILKQNQALFRCADVLEQEEKRCGADCFSQRQIYENVLAPVLLEYIKWVLWEAKRNGKERLYFLARDGYQMYLAAKELCKLWNLKIDCRYLKVSRYAVRVPEYHILGKRCLERICIGGIDVTFAKIMGRAALTEAEGKEIAKLCGYSECYEKIMNYQEVMHLKQILAEIPLFFEYVNRHSAAAYHNTIGYFKQEGLFDAYSYALVDSGWTGTIQQSIKNLLKQEQSAMRLEGYYFGLYEIPKMEKREDYHSFYFSPWGEIRRKVHFSNCLFEAVFSAPEGMTLSYRKKSDGQTVKYIPVLDSRESQNKECIKNYVSWLKNYLELYVRYTDGSFLAAENTVWEADVRIVEGLLAKFMGEPTRFETEAYGNLLFSDDVKEDDSRSVCAKLSEQEIKDQHFFSKLCIMLGLKKTVLKESAWIEGSIVSNGKNRKKNLRHAVMYKYFIYIRKWFRQYFGSRG